MQGQLWEKEIIKYIQQGDVNAFRRLVDRYKEQAVRTAFAVCGNLEDAQDIVQEAFIRVFKNIGKFNFKAKFSTWFYAILINLCRDWLKKKKKRAMVTYFEDANDENPLPKETADKNRGPKEMLINAELAQKIENAISGLSAQQQLVFNLKHRQGMKIDEIAGIMGINNSTVKVHLFRAVERLRVKLGHYLNQR